MWPSCVETEDYFVMYYFEHIAALKMPYHWTFVKGGVYMRFTDAWVSDSMKGVWTLFLIEVQW